MKTKLIILIVGIFLIGFGAAVGISLANFSVDIDETSKDVLDNEDFNYTYVDSGTEDYTQRTIIVEGYCNLPQSSEPHYYKDYKGSELEESLNAYMVRELEDVANNLEAGICDIKPTDITGEGNITIS